ncbi:MAG: hypothetical protein MN733_28395, partial [Nitrososphaera sp.]|nr:hypothetical protein [Nitrososphaera sp.]
MPSKVYELRVGNVSVEAALYGVTSYDVSKIFTDLRVDVPGAKFLWKYKSGEWDGKADLFRVSNVLNINGKLTTCLKVPTGLFPILHDVCIRQWGVNAGTIHDIRHIPSTNLQPASVPLRPYQFEAISKAFGSKNQLLGWWPRAVIQVATGGGKTEMAVAMYQM